MNAADRISQLHKRIAMAAENLANYVRIREELLVMHKADPKRRNELLKLNAEIANTMRSRIAFDEEELERLENSAR